METLYEQNLILAGLTKDEAKAYETLVKLGAMQAGDLGRNIQISSRPLIYKVLDDLVTKGLVEKKEIEGKVAKFYPAHPLKLKEFADKERENAERSIVAVEGVIDKLISDFNLTSGKPGVRFFEGRAGIKSVLDDSLTAQSVIYSYIDVEAVERDYTDINTPYLKAREKFGIKKKLLVSDTQFIRNVYKDSAETASEVRMIPKSAATFEVSMQIYDKKVSYLTLIPGKEIGVIIEDEHIARMHRHLFEVLYERAEPLYVPKAEVME